MKKLFLLSSLFALAAASAAQSQYPDKPIRIMVPYPPGGAADAVSRDIGAQLTQKLGQAIVVENRSGANGNIGAAACKSARADGYTLCMIYSDIFTINPFVYKNIPFGVEKDFVPVAGVVNVDVVVLAPTSAKIARLNGDWHKKSSTLNWSSTGMGGSSHLLMSKINATFGTSIAHVPYQGGGPAMQSLLSNEAQFSMIGLAQALPHITAGKVVPLAVLGDKRSVSAPDVPSIAEAGIDFSGTVWLGLFAPAGMDPAQILKINHAVNEILEDPKFVAQNLRPGGYTPIAGAPEALIQRVRRDQKEWRPLADSLNLGLEK